MNFLEQRIEECYEDLEMASSLLKKISMEFGTTSRMAEGCSAAVCFGVDKQDAVKRIDMMVGRLTQLEQVSLNQGFSDFR